MTRVRGLLPFFATVIALGLIIGLFGFSASLNPVDVVLGRGRQISAPNLTGMPLPRAKAEADRVGLKLTERSAYSLTVQRGSVIRQEPTGGSSVRVGDSLELTISKGENNAPMPDAVGKPLRSVRKPLDDASIKVSVDRVYSESVERGIVMSQSPEPRVILRGGETAHFEVSRGPEKRPVPQVSGMTAPGAAFLLGQSGLALGEVTMVDDATVPAGAVVSTEPKQGASVAKGTKVELRIAAGPAPLAVPDVTTQPQDAALRALSTAGFRALVAERILSPEDPTIGTVLEQSPPATTMLRPDQRVTVVIGVKPPDPPPTTTTTTTTTIAGATTTAPVTTTTRPGGR